MLLLDIGNTRIKWAWWRNHEIVDAGQAPGSGPLVQVLDRMTHGRRGPTRVYASNVAGAAVGETLNGLLHARYGAVMQFAQVESHAFGVRIAYAQPGRLGVDRWLAMLGARRRTKAPVCVVDAGTTLTIDALDSDGQHLGGLIAPGIELMRRSVLANTAGVAERAVADPGELNIFAADTAPALSAGAYYAAAALVERAHSELHSRGGMPPRILLTGGGAVGLPSLIRADVGVVEHLVLEGLALVAERDGQ